jgi:hypothetical protein
VSTAIAVYNSEGCVGRCDAKCHDATEPDCDCICGGRLHGVGAGRAIEQNTRDLLGDELADELRAFADRNGLDVDELRVEVPGVQLELGGES